MTRRWMLALPFVLLSCDAPQDAAPRQSVRAATPYVDQLRALSEMNRGLALRRAIQDSGAACKKVDASGYQEDFRNMSMWTARCSDTGDWALFIAPNGDVQVRDCADAAQLELPVCRLAQTPA